MADRTSLMETEGHVSQDQHESNQREALLGKLKDGQKSNEESHHQLQQVKFYQNLTSNQFTHQDHQHLDNMSSSSGALNPQRAANMQQMRQIYTEAYRYRHGVEHANWPHFMMRNMYKNVMKFKFNYALKGFALYYVVSDIQNYRYMQTRTYMTSKERISHFQNITVHGGFCAAAFLLV